MNNKKKGRTPFFFIHYALRLSWMPESPILYYILYTLPPPSASVERYGRFMPVLAASENKQAFKIEHIALLDLKL